MKQNKRIMNCYFKYIMLVVASVFALSSCEEKDVEVYGNEAYLVFEMPGYGLNNTPRDSMVFSFPAKGDECVEDTLWFKARIIGKSVPYDREIKFVVNEETTTAKKDENYKLDPVSMPANSYTVDVPLVVYRAGLKDKSVRLELTVEPNEYFGVGFEKTSKAIFCGEICLSSRITGILPIIRIVSGSLPRSVMLSFWRLVASWNYRTRRIL